MKSSPGLSQRALALTAMLLLCFGLRPVPAATIAWDGADALALVNTNWSDVKNWAGGVLPGVNDTALFDDNGASPNAGPANADNIVDTNLVIAALQYSQTNGNFHNTIINPNVTLTAQDTNISIMLECGTQSDPPSGMTHCYNTISGGGALVVINTNAGSAICVQQGSATYTGAPGLWATLDMSGLNTFQATVGRLMVAVEGVGASPGQVDLFDDERATGRLYLAQTNVIALTQPGNIQGAGNAAAAGPALVVGDVYASYSDNPSALDLGQSNAIFADTITIGRNGSLQSAVFEFNTNAFPTDLAIYLRGETSERVAEFVIADSTLNGNSSQYEAPDPRIPVTPQLTGGFNVGESAVVDLSAGTCDMMIDSLIVGKGYGGAGGGYVAALFSMGAGTLNVNTLQLGVMSSAGGNRPVTGILNVNSGAVIVNSNQVSLGVALGNSPTATATGNLNVSGGSLNVANGAYGIADGGQSASQITFSNATVTVANIGSASAPIGSITLADSTLNLAVSSLSGTIVAAQLTTSSNTKGVLLNILSLPPLAGLQPVVTLISSASPISNVGAFNGGVSGFVLKGLPAGYAGHLETTPSSVLLVLTQSPNVPNAWTGADFASQHNANWSDGRNWSSGAEPGSASPAYFLAGGSAASSALSRAGGGPEALLAANVNNVVDGAVSTPGLFYINTNGTYQNTFITNGATLLAGAGGLGLVVGSPGLDYGNTTVNVTISGPGVLTVNSNVYVGLGDSTPGSAAEAVLDMSALNTFDASVLNFLVGAGTVAQPAGVIYLAQTNTITASSSQADDSDSAPVALEIGDAEAQAGNIGSILYLGETNTINAASIAVARQLASGAIRFNPPLTNSNPTVLSGPWAYFRGAGGGASAVASWTIGDAVNNPLSTGVGNFAGSGLCDFTGGYVNALVDTLTIANSPAVWDNITYANAVSGTLTFGAGTIQANTLNVSYNNAIGTSLYDYGVGTVNLNGAAELIVTGTLNLAFAAGSPSAPSVLPAGTLDIDGGAVFANTIVPGTNSAISTIIVNGGSLTFTNPVGAPAAPLTTLNLTNATLGVGLAAGGDGMDVGSLNVDGVINTSNKINIVSLPPIVASQYPKTLTLIQSATPMTLGGDHFNFLLGSFPQASPKYTGAISQSPDHTAVMLTVLSGPAGARGSLHWNGPDPATGSINWSDPANWQLPSVPVAGETVYFDNTGESFAPGAANADNIVDTNLTVAGLWFVATNTSPDFAYHNTVINPGVTLTLQNTNVTIMLEAGTDADPSSGKATCYNTISGGGALLVINTNAGSAICVQQGSATYTGAAGLWATLDMSGLSTFNATVGRLMVAVQGVGPTPGQVNLFSDNRATGILHLAATNLITLTQAGNVQGAGNAATAGPALVVGDVYGNYSDNPSALFLGQSNAIFADTITIGRNGSLQSSVLEFDAHAFPGGSSLYLRGTSSNRVAEFVVADSTLNGNSSRYEAPDSRIPLTPQLTGGFNVQESAVVDVSQGTSDMMIDTLILGQGHNAAGGGYVAALFSMGAGTLNVNTLLLGVMSSAAGNHPVTGILKVPSQGVVTVNDQLALGRAVAGGVSTWAAGNLWIDGGTVSAVTIVPSGSANSSIVVTNGGALSLTSVSGSIGTVTAPLGKLTIDDSTLNLALGSTGPTVVCSNLTTALTPTVNTINITDLPVIPGTPATVTLIQAVNPAVGTFNFSLGSLPSGYAAHIPQAFANGNAVQLVVTGTPSAPNGKGASITGLSSNPAAGSVVLSGANGLADGVFYVLGSTNLATPITNWTHIATSTFDSAGRFSLSLPFSITNRQQFYLIDSQ